MSIKIGINGFGRIGRLVFRAERRGPPGAWRGPGEQETAAPPPGSGSGPHDPEGSAPARESRQTTAPLRRQRATRQDLLKGSWK